MYIENKYSKGKSQMASENKILNVDLNDDKEYFEMLDSGFHARLTAQTGDGIIEGLNEGTKGNQSTIKIQFRGEPHYFVYFDHQMGPCLVHESKIEAKEMQYHFWVYVQKTDPEILYAYQQLLCNPWEDAEKIGIEF